ncbi:MAG: hypothetical protein IT240_08025 [Bacteroidia bacterium]|nr:hypothetical protein [Bacteroidia bacterium]MCC6768977.1 hypothetical protein [Bacteroidia bacterium]
MTNAEELILQTLKEKAILKQDIFKLTIEAFEQFKQVLQEITEVLQKEVEKIDKRIQLEYSEKSPFSVHLRIAGDVLIFEMHTNVFLFDSTHKVWGYSYVSEEPSRAYCGLINIYNFLSDSLKFKRVNDVGYLVGRIFINQEQHFFVEGKRQMGFLYNNFSTDILNRERMREVIESAILYCLNFDLLTPPYNAVQEAAFSQIAESAQNINAATGKRLGFRFHHDEDPII